MRRGVTNRLAFLSALWSLLLLAACTPPPVADPQEIRAALEGQVAAWNRGDMDGFLAVYWPDPSLTFFSGGSVTQGFAPFAERFKARYGQAPETMGRLEFRQLEIRPLAAAAAFARGEWHLERAGQEAQGGLFTLILEHREAGWQIIHDHTSVFDPPPVADPG